MTARAVLAAAQAQGVMITTAESCTGGLVAAALTDLPGASAVVDRGFVTYSNAAKTELLRVPAKVIAQHGAVSEQVAALMALGALAASQAQLAVSITGVAGPGGTDHKPEGMVCFGTARDGAVRTETVQFGALGRAQVRAAAAQHALALLSARLQG
ncbi:MAG: nicotinamide-nucleotide amidohydrolase family protein [Pseudomonadota bacterium]